MSLHCEDVQTEHVWAGSYDNLCGYDDFDTVSPAADAGEYDFTSIVPSIGAQLEFLEKDSRPDRHIDDEHAGAFIIPPFLGVEEFWSVNSSPSECLSTDMTPFPVDDFGQFGVVEEQGRRCGKCLQRFQNAYSLEQHAKSSGHRIYDCKVPGCDRSYCRRDLLTRHRKAHDTGHMCSICREKNQMRSFKRRDHLLQHFRNCHPNSPLPLAASSATESSKRPIAEANTKGKCSCPCTKRKATTERSEGNSSSQQRSDEASTDEDLETEMQKACGQSLRESLELSKTSTNRELALKINELAQQKPLSSAK